MSTAAEPVPAEESVPPRPPSRIMVNQLKMRFETSAGDSTDAQLTPSAKPLRERVAQSQPPVPTRSTLLVNARRSRFDRPASPTSPALRQSAAEPPVDRITRFSTLQRNASQNHHYNALEAPQSLLNRSDGPGLPSYAYNTLGRVGTLPRSQRQPDKYMSLGRPARKPNGAVAIGVAPKQPKVEPVEIDISLQKDDEPVSYSPALESPTNKTVPLDSTRVSMFRRGDSDSLSGPLVSRSTYERVLHQIRQSQIAAQLAAETPESDSAIESRQTNTENTTPQHATDGTLRATQPNSLVVTLNEVHHQGYIIKKNPTAGDGAGTPGQSSGNYSLVMSYERNENSLLNTQERAAPKAQVPPGLQVSSGLALSADKHIVRKEPDVAGDVEETAAQQRTTIAAQSAPPSAAEKPQKKKKSLGRRILEFLRIKKRKDKEPATSTTPMTTTRPPSETQTLPRAGKKGSRDKFKEKDVVKAGERYGTAPRVPKAKSATPAPAPVPVPEKESSPSPAPAANDTVTVTATTTTTTITTTSTRTQRAATHSHSIWRRL